MKQLKMIAITLLLLLIVCTMKPFVVDADGKNEKLERCEKATLRNIFNSSNGTIDTSYENIATEFYNNICDCSYYDCNTRDGDNYDLDQITEFIEFAQALFGYINQSGNISDLKKASDKNKNITEFDELIDSCYVNQLNIGDYYQCSVNNKCSSGSNEGEEGSINGEESCSGFIGQDTADLIKEILDYVRFFGPFALVIYSALDYARAVAGKYNGNEDALETAKIKVGKRFIALLLFLFIPTILKIIFNTIEDAITFSADCVLNIQSMFLWR